MTAAALIPSWHRQFTGVLVLLSLFLTAYPQGTAADDLDPPAWRGTADTTFQEWGFNTFPAATMDLDSVNCSAIDERGIRWGHRGAPDRVVNPFQKLNRVCAEFKTMWSFTDKINWVKEHFGRSGVWRLSASSDSFNSLDFLIPNKLSRDNSNKDIQVQVIYETAGNEPLVTVQVLETEDATRQSRRQPVRTSAARVLPLGWVQRTYFFELGHCPVFENVRIFSAEHEDIHIDSVVIDSICKTAS